MPKLKPFSLCDKTKPWGEIRFIHKDGKEHTFYCMVNTLTGSRMTAFDSNPPDIGESLEWVKTVFRDIHAKAKVLEAIGPLAILKPPKPPKEKKKSA